MSTNAAESTTALDDRLSVAAAVRAHYGAAGMSAAALAREIGMSQSKMSRRTTGAEPFDIDELSAIAAALDVGIIDLISGTNLPRRPRATAGAGEIRTLWFGDDDGVTRRNRGSDGEVVDLFTREILTEVVA